MASIDTLSIFGKKISGIFRQCYDNSASLYNKDLINQLFSPKTKELDGRFTFWLSARKRFKGGKAKHNR